jgi:hypothetical protein
MVVPAAILSRAYRIEERAISGSRATNVRNLRLLTIPPPLGGDCKIRPASILTQAAGNGSIATFEDISDRRSKMILFMFITKVAQRAVEGGDASVPCRIAPVARMDD